MGFKLTISTRFKSSFEARDEVADPFKKEKNKKIDKNITKIPRNVGIFTFSLK
jgi:hypothetical protein